jgi:hypothetical protein
LTNTKIIVLAALFISCNCFAQNNGNEYSPIYVRYSPVLIVKLYNRLYRIDSGKHTTTQPQKIEMQHDSLKKLLSIYVNPAIGKMTTDDYDDYLDMLNYRNGDSLMCHDKDNRLTADLNGVYHEYVKTPGPDPSRKEREKYIAYEDLKHIYHYCPIPDFKGKAGNIFLLPFFIIPLIIDACQGDTD